MNIKGFCDEKDKEMLTEQLIRTKGKRKTYKTRQKEIFVEVKFRIRSGKCVGVAQSESEFNAVEKRITKKIEDEEKIKKTLEQLIHTKGKRKTYTTRQKEIFVEVKNKARSGKCSAETAQLESEFVKPISYNTINNEVWYHVSKYIAPHEVRTFALICRQTAEVVNTCEFWVQIYRRYCSAAAEDPWELPEHLQFANLDNCDMKTLRVHVVETLFRCYKPFVDRLKCSYSLKKLRGCTFEAFWHELYQRTWFMYYKFHKKISLNCNEREEANIFVIDDEVSDWESLAENEARYSKQLTAHAYTYEGVYLLVISCDRFTPFPIHWMCESSKSQVQLSALEPNSVKDVRGIYLKLDFCNRVRKDTATVLYQKILSCEVIPWWHPGFRTFFQ